MSTDWSNRGPALEYFERAWKNSKRFNDDEKDHYEQAVYALRRSQDHTAIQTKLNETVAEVARLREALQRIVAEGDYTAPEGMKRIARSVLAQFPSLPEGKG